MGLSESQVQTDTGTVSVPATPTATMQLHQRDTRHTGTPSVPSKLQYPIEAVGSVTNLEETEVRG